MGNTNEINIPDRAYFSIREVEGITGHSRGVILANITPVAVPGFRKRKIRREDLLRFLGRDEEPVSINQLPKGAREDIERAKGERL